MSCARRPSRGALRAPVSASSEWSVDQQTREPRGLPYLRSPNIVRRRHRKRRDACVTGDALSAGLLVLSERLPQQVGNPNDAPRPA